MRYCIRDERGQGLVEYLILVALMGVAAIGVVRVLGQTVDGKFAQVIGALRGNGQEKRVKFETLEEGHYELRDMSNFINRASPGEGANGSQGSSEK